MRHPHSPARKDICLAHSFIAFNGASYDLTETIKAKLSLNQELLVHSVDKTVAFAYRPRQEPAATLGHLRESDDLLTLVLGDESEPDASPACQPSGYAAMVEINLVTKHIRVISSMVGLPPLFIYYDPSRSWTILTSSWVLLRSLEQCNLQFDPHSLVQVCDIGYPLEHRTLFRNVRLVPAGHEVILDHSHVVLKKLWELPDKQHTEYGLTEYTARQIDAFEEGLGCIDLAGGFLSLTAGLDTRAIFSGIVRRERNIPARTLTGEAISLDGTIAQQLCYAYGIEHETVPLDETFQRKLPTYAATASLLSGGLVGLEEAHEVYFHEIVSRRFTARISGNLGNQLGRHAVERISKRKAHPAFFHPDLKNMAASQENGLWESKNPGSTVASEEWPLLKETLFSQLANYCIGASYCIQRSPYAKRGLIQLISYRPRCLRPHNTGYRTLRTAQIRHLFLGEQLHRSFQRRMITETGGFVASCPVNWGWRPQGGISWRGLGKGILACSEVLAHKFEADAPFLQDSMAAIGMLGLHEICLYRRWFRIHMKEFILDTILSRSAKECGLFHFPKINQILEDYFDGKRGLYTDLVTAFDLALAQQQFRASL